MARKCLREISRWFLFFVSFLPGVVGVRVREVILRWRIKKSGRRIYTGMGVEFSGCQNIEIGDDAILMRFGSVNAEGGKITIGHRFSMNSNVLLGAADGGEIVIGNHVMIGPNVVLRASDHVISDTHKPMADQGHTGGKIVINDDCWICANAVITRNVTIGSHSVVAAGAVVTKDVDPFSVVAGVPARPIIKRAP